MIWEATPYFIRDADLEKPMDWDVFISHASEDKATVARPLAELLRKAGLKVWLDENQARRSVMVVGVLKRLPIDSVGERHIVGFEERTGPEPPGANDGVCRVYLTEDDVNL